jgi:hypothetical protein
MGSELLVDSGDMSRGRVNFRRIPEEYKKLIGGPVKIIEGNWKGYYGNLKNITDKNAMVELSSRNKIVTVSLSSIEDMDNNLKKNSNRMDYISTPRATMVPKTPSYYPQSPSFNPTSPKWNPSATRNILIILILFS